MAITKRNKRTLLAGSMLAAAGLLGACSGSVHVGATPEIPQDKLGTLVKGQLETKFKAKADSVVCDGGLRGEVGSTQRCLLTAGSTKVGVTVTATSVDGDNVKYDIVVDDKAMK